MKKTILRIKRRIKKSLLIKTMEIKKELKTQKRINEGLKIENHKLIDEITLKNLKIREMYLENAKR